MSINDLSDIALFQRIAKGDQAALSSLYDRHAGQMWGIAIKILKDAHLAEEAVQDVFVKVWQQSDRFSQNKGKPLTWMSYICRNRCIDILRGRNKDYLTEALEPVQWEQIFQEQLNGPDQEAQRSELANVIKKALLQLPKEQKNILELAYLEGYSQSQIAKKLDLPLGTVKSRMRLAMEKLRNDLLTKIDYP